jgi:N-acetylglucosamine kinase-like BadF-type ATPase
MNDGFAALRLATGSGQGVGVTCGTWAAVASCGADGSTWYSGQWMPRTSGARGLGEGALLAACRAELAIEPSSLLEQVLALYGAETAGSLLESFTRRENPRPAADEALAARLVLDEAERGDSVATRLLDEQASLLADYALVAATKTGLAESAFPIVLTGGVLRHPSPLLADLFSQKVRAAAPGARPIREHAPPVVGAAVLALEAAGVPVSDTVRVRIRESVYAALAAAALQKSSDSASVSANRL